MKNIIPFKKDVIFKTNLSEITSISLENTLNLEKDIVKGEFIISGEYKISDNSTTVEPFELNIPFEIVIDDRYDTKLAKVDIDDFYYEIVNNNVLSISIDVLIDRLEEKTVVELEDLTDMTPVRDIIESEEEIMERNSIFEKENIIEEVKEENKEEKITKDEMEEKINSLFNPNSFNNEIFITYNVYIIRDGDNLDTIMEKYNISEDELKKYNDLSNLQLGDKIIIPNKYERN